MHDEFGFDPKIVCDVGCRDDRAWLNVAKGIWPDAKFAVVAGGADSVVLMQELASISSSIHYPVPDLIRIDGRYFEGRSDLLMRTLQLVNTSRGVQYLLVTLPAATTPTTTTNYFGAREIDGANLASSVVSLGGWTCVESRRQDGGAWCCCFKSNNHHSNTAMSWATVPLLCINLDHRTDRLAAVTAELARLGRTLTSMSSDAGRPPLRPTWRVSASNEPTAGALGCAKSHLWCIEMAIARDWPAVAILEDDLMCVDDSAFVRSINSFFTAAATSSSSSSSSSPPPSWDVLLLGTDPSVYERAPAFGTEVFRVKVSSGSEGYIVNGSYLPVLRDHLRESVRQLTLQPHNRDFSLDIHWHHLQARDTWLMNYPFETITQVPGFSDIEMRQCNSSAARESHRVWREEQERTAAAKRMKEQQQQEEEERRHLQRLSAQRMLPTDHVNFLWKLRQEFGFEPKVVYDIGCCVLHWTNEAKRVWPNAEYALFDAFAPAAFLYQCYKHAHVGVLSDEDGKVVKFFQNNTSPGGNSYYREVGDFFPADRFVELTCATLDTVAASRGFPAPDLVKIDVQGCELDILRGALRTLQSAQYLIVEMQDTNYNDGAPKVDVTMPFIESLGWTCIARKFSDNGPDADYCFKRNAVAAAEPLLSWDTVPLLCINLDHRTDRLAAVTAELARLGRVLGCGEEAHTLRVSAVNGAEAGGGALGCSKSHLKCLELAAARSWPAVVILEDDFVCINRDAFLRATDAFLETVSRSNLEWDVLLLGTDPMCTEEPPTHSYGKGVRRVLCSYGSEGYIVNGSYLATFRDHLRAGIDLFAAHPHQPQMYAFDVHWHQLQARDKWFMSYPLTVVQTPGFSDISYQMADPIPHRMRRHEYVAESNMRVLVNE